MKKIFDDFQAKQKKYRNREVPLTEVLQDLGVSTKACQHENLINVGDADHDDWVCSNCKVDPSYDICPECGTTLKCEREEREGHNSEMVWYCGGCGYTGVEKPF